MTARSVTAREARKGESDLAIRAVWFLRYRKEIGQTREKTGPIIYSTVVVVLRTIDHTWGGRDIASAAECTMKAKRRKGRVKGMVR